MYYQLNYREQLLLTNLQLNRKIFLYLHHSRSLPAKTERGPRMSPGVVSLLDQPIYNHC